MSYNLGGYSNQLQLDGLTDNDLNQALANSGSSYQLEPQAAPQAATMTMQPIQTAQPVAQPQAVDTEKPPGIQPPSVDNLQAPREEKKQGSALGKILGIVGAIYTGGATAAVGAAANAAK